MLISDESKKERQFIVSYAKDLAGRWTEESWKMLQCATVEKGGLEPAKDLCQYAL